MAQGQPKTKLQRTVEAFEGKGWTLDVVRKELDACNEEFEMHLETCELCRDEMEAYCPLARRLLDRDMELTAMLLGLGAAEEERRRESRRARRRKAK